MPHGCNDPASVVIDPRVNTGPLTADNAAKADDSNKNITITLHWANGRAAAIPGAAILAWQFPDKAKHSVGDATMLACALIVWKNLEADLLQPGRKCTRLIRSTRIVLHRSAPSGYKYSFIRLQRIISGDTCQRNTDRLKSVLRRNQGGSVRRTHRLTKMYQSNVISPGCRVIARAL